MTFVCACACADCGGENSECAKHFHLLRDAIENVLNAHPTGTIDRREVFDAWTEAL